MSSKILFIDRSGDGRAPFAAAYGRLYLFQSLLVDLLRLWRANTTPTTPPTWTFRSISTAGLHLTTDFTALHSTYFPHHALHTTHQDRHNRSLRLLLHPDSFSSAESRMVLSRVGNRRMRGIHASDFMTYDFIVAFDQEDYELLKVLKGCAERDNGWAPGSARAHVQLVEIHPELWKHPYLVPTAKDRLRHWASRNVGWSEPNKGFKEGLYRSRQVVINEAGYRALMRDGERRAGQIKAETGCEIYFGIEGEMGDPGNRVISCVGKWNRVDGCVVRVLESW
ncbi:hypothetical protein BGZ60DRAFT_213099 [Tricladium varicosporioides]|nr:hypothetical protein BGZ60DRAFT_213099 [Hymenoscyphus varicosporioides]